MIKRLYQCKKCKLFYKDKEIAKQCEEYCKSHKSCSLLITKHAVKR